MLYYTETNIETTSTSHFRTFLRATARSANKEKDKRDLSGSMASRAAA